MVWSRSHTVSLPRSGRQGALAPLVDMFNHALQPNLGAASTEVERADGIAALVVRASQPLGSNEEATVPYGGSGPLSSARLLMDYGFCVEEDVHDDVALPLPLPRPADPRAQVLRRLRLLPPDTPPPRLQGGGAPLPLEAVVYARIATVDPPEEAHAEAMAAMTDLEDFARHASGLPQVRRFLHAACQARLHEYATSVSEDTALLEAAKATSDGAARERLRCAIVVRRSEKRILESWIRTLAEPEVAAAPSVAAPVAGARMRMEL